ncbi:PorP/SprF family type IX secretion system membrane protein [Draconibacterium sp. IB214405]|uniref:PorP/SprF family type IX secretion system membrane protein n=1 Tax=Draconibacterium sp. IB214405 TaxID=3097352 RepID=UPI002A104879|nr:PorP/SprF family type IX secretion system membrane protein [Draconibacterium sp. IB214405]MDX8339705.1 PorP/SprF family type IX secretion system membrane protein [Draconibacterium sp. IB214405]
MIRNAQLICLVAFLWMGSQKLFAQTDIGESSHWYNRGNYNPASIARPGYLYIFSNYRRQWVGIDGAPTVYNLNASGYVDEYNSAFGIALTKDEVGLTSALNPTFQYAYRVMFREDLNLAMGLSAGIYSREINATAYEAEVITDPVLDYTTEKFFSPDASVGFELQSKHFLYGLSTTHLFALWKEDDEFLITNHRYAYFIYRNSELELYNLTAGVQVANRRNLTLVQATAILRIKKPTGLIKGPTELFDIGVTAYSEKQLTLLTGINITRNMRVGYTYDFNFGANKIGNGSHEIVFEYRIPLRIIRDNGYPWYD